MLGRLSLLLLSLAAFVSGYGCNRSLSDVTAGVPEFLGPYSGVYDGLEEQFGLEAGTIVVEFRGKLLFAPYSVLDGAVSASIFSSAMSLSERAADGSATVAGAADLLLPVDVTFGAGATCSSAIAEPTDAASFLELFGACLIGPCEIPCFLANPFEFVADRESGTCVDGTTCIYPDQRFAGRVSTEGVELYFDQVTTTPGSSKAIPCPEGSSWRRCFGLRKQCEFDARLAGVYALALEGGEEHRSLDAAIALADNVAAMALFTGSRLYFGTFDPFDFSFHLEAIPLGTGADRASTIDTEIDGRIVESSTALRIEGTWVETIGSETRTLAMRATRSSGSRAGRTCTQQPECPTRALHCPGGNIAPPGHSLVLTDEVLENGCIETTCTRVIDATGRCSGTVTSCTPIGANLANQYLRTDSLSFGLACRDGSTCTAEDLCLEIACQADPGLDSAVFVDPACDAPEATMVLGYDRTFRLTSLACPPLTPYCSDFAPICPLGAFPGLSSSIEPVQTEPCFLESCWQRITEAMLCGGGSFPTCDATPTGMQAAVASAVDLDADDQPDCVAVTCEQRPQLLQGVPCYALPNAQPPSSFDPSLGVDVSDVLGCPQWREHLP